MTSGARWPVGSLVALVVVVCVWPRGAAAQAGEGSGTGTGTGETGGIGEVVAIEPEPVGGAMRWDPAWGEVAIPEYLMFGVSVIVSIVNLGIGPREDNPTTGGWLFDDGTRRELRLETHAGRRTALDASDILLATMMSYPILIDAAVVAGWHHRSPEVAIQMALIDAEVIAVTLAIQTTFNMALSRERPYGTTCGGDDPDDLPADTRMCEPPGRYLSFFSGHTSQSFAAAAVTCMHHAYLPLYGGGLADAVPCMAGFALAGVTGLLRILGDVHYATDVSVGAVIGTGVGLLLPWLLHYRKGPAMEPGDRPEADELSASFARQPRASVTVVPQGLGLGVSGTF